MLDRKGRRAQFLMARTAESSYNSRLRAVAKQIDLIVKGFHNNGVIDTQAVIDTLKAYSIILMPWARSVASYMVADVNRRNERAWRQSGDDLSKALQSEILYAPTGHLFTGLMNEQVKLITSLPTDAAARVHKLTTEAMTTTGVRADAIAKQILATGEVSASRARLIARTEVARTASSLTQARARFAGSLGYIWRTSGDSDVRPTHKAQNGKYIPWDKPPKTDKGLDPYHAGCGPNCFTGETQVDLSNGCWTLWRVFYDGELIDLIAGGRFFSATPNHPILTTRGWMAAGLIQCGDNVLAMGEQKVNIIKNDEDDVIPSFDELFVALSTETNTLMLTNTGKFDFHGDILDGQIQQITLKWLLSGNTESVIHQELRKFVLTTADSRITWSKLTHITKPDCTGIRNLLTALFRSLAGHCKDISLTSLTNGDSQTHQQFVDGESSCLVLLGQCASAEPLAVLAFYLKFRKITAAVVGRSNSSGDLKSLLTQHGSKSLRMTANDLGCFPDKASAKYESLSVTQKSIRNFAGHVYTLESNTGWFGITAAGIISKNCRCYPDPVLPSL